MDIRKSQVKSLMDRALNQAGKLRKGGTQVCYFCKCGHYKRKLELSLEYFVYNCWVCKKSGNIYKLLKLFNAPKSYYIELHSIIGDTHKHSTFKPNIDTGELTLPDAFHPISKKRNTPEYKNALLYLKQRGVRPCDIIRYNIGYCEGYGDYEQHIIIPSYDGIGKLNFFIGRRYYEIEGTALPYKKPRKNMNVVGFECLINWKEPPILVEGVFNAITIRNNAIPMFGKYPSKKLYEAMIVNHVKKVYVCLDSDAKDDSMMICEQLLSLGITPYFVKINGGKDPNEVGFKQMQKFIKDATEIDWTGLLRYKLNH